MRLSRTWHRQINVRRYVDGGCKIVVRNLQNGHRHWVLLDAEEVAALAVALTQPLPGRRRRVASAPPAQSV